MALWLLWTAFSVARHAWAQLMDRELPNAERDLIIKLALEDPAVKAVHDLRTRASDLMFTFKCGWIWTITCLWNRPMILFWPPKGA